MSESGWIGVTVSVVAISLAVVLSFGIRGCTEYNIEVLRQGSSSTSTTTYGPQR